MTTNRRLAAIMVADVVGYSRMMEQDEVGTLAILQRRRKDILEPVVKAHGGRIVKVMGDGVLVEFASAVKAVEGAIELLTKMAQANETAPESRQIVLRIGINLSDVIGDGSDIYGEGVNIAARLEALAEPGSLWVSAKVREEVKGKIALAFDDMGEQVLKNITESVRAYRVSLGTAISPSRSLSPTQPGKPSIAVLPFQNMSGDSDQEYFADGMVEEIITALSRFSGLFVIARNSTFTYKGRPVDVRQVGRELGVRYVLEGSVRKAANRIRIAGQLIDASTGTHLWADRFEGALEEVFCLQDQVTTSVVSAITPKLEQAEIERSRRKPTESLDAYDYYLRGLASVHQWTKEANEEALSYFSQAVELDPKFAAAYGWAARCYSQRKAGGWVTNPAQDTAEASTLARRAADLGRDDAVALCTAGIALANVVGDLEDSAAFTDRALALNPNLVWAWQFSGWVKLMRGETEAALKCFEQAMRLSPNDPQIFLMQDGMATAHFVAGRYDEALSSAKAVMRDKPDFLISICTAASCAGLLGQIAESKKPVASLLELEPTIRISNLEQHVMPMVLLGSIKFKEGLRLAGLPE